MSERPILLFGGSGLLGTVLLPELRRRHVPVLAPARQVADICQPEALRPVLLELRPPWVINLAAATSVDALESDPDTAFRVNARAAGQLARLCTSVGARLLHISTDYVFDGLAASPYSESDVPAPLNIYGQSKLLGELLVQRHCAEHLIVRVSALFGPGRAHFVSWVLDNADRRSPLRIVADGQISPTPTQALAEQLCTLVEHDCRGIFHAAGHETATWYEVARAALDFCGRSHDGIKAVCASELGRAAQRPMCSALANAQLARRGLDCMPPWRDGLRRYLGAAT